MSVQDLPLVSPLYFHVALDRLESGPHMAWHPPTLSSI